MKIIKKSYKPLIFTLLTLSVFVPGMCQKNPKISANIMDPLTTAPSGSINHPNVSMTTDDLGRLYIARILTEDTGIQTIKFTKSVDQGKNWSIPVVITPPEDSILSEPQITVNKDGSLVYIGWLENGKNINLVTVYKSGDKSPIVQVNDKVDKLLGGLRMKHYKGSLFLCWEDNGSIYLDFSSYNNPLQFGTDIKIGNETSQNSFPDLIVFDNEIYLLFIDEATKELVITKSSIDSIDFRERVIISDNHVDKKSPSLAIGSGNIYVVWEELPNDASSYINIDRSTLDLASFGKDKRIGSKDIYAHTPAVITTKEDCIIVVAYEGEKNIFNKRIVLATSKDCGETFDTTTVDQSESDIIIQNAPLLALKNGPELYLMWENMNKEDKDVLITDVQVSETGIEISGLSTLPEPENGDIKEDDNISDVVHSDNDPDLEDTTVNKRFNVYDNRDGSIKLEFNYQNKESVKNEQPVFGRFEIFKDNTLIAVIEDPLITSFTEKESNLVDEESHTYTLRILDINGDLLEEFTTLNNQGSVSASGDKTPPTTPGKLSVREVVFGEEWGGAVEVNWDEAKEIDFKEYRVYRSDTKDFKPEGEQPGEGNLIAILDENTNSEQDVEFLFKGKEQVGVGSQEIEPGKSADIVKVDSDYLKNEIIIKFQPSATEEGIEELISKYKLIFKSEIDVEEKRAEKEQKTNPLFIREKSEEEIELNKINYTGLNAKLDIYHMLIPGLVDIYNLQINLSNEEIVKYSELVAPVESSLTSDDPYLEEQWAVDAISLKPAWDMQTDSPDVVIALVDTGIQINHEDLSKNIYVNKSDIPADGIDNDSNGYIDDVHGWNYVSNNADVQDDMGHGTMVSGAIAAKTNNGTGISGATWKTQIMAVKVLNDQSRGTTTDIAKGILYAVSNGANIICIPSGTETNSKVVSEAVDLAWDKGVLVIASAGNRGDQLPIYPAALPKVISVSSIDKSGQKSVFSSFGDEVTIAAPGSNILTTALYDPDNLEDVKYTTVSGTSMSAGYVAGAISLLLQNRGMVPVCESKEKSLKPTGQSQGVKSLLAHISQIL